MTKPKPASLDARRRRLLYRATHRGTYENDILLGGFVQRYIGAFQECELVALEVLLELPAHPRCPAGCAEPITQQPAGEQTPRPRAIDPRLEPLKKLAKKE